MCYPCSTANRPAKRPAQPLAVRQACDQHFGCNLRMAWLMRGYMPDKIYIAHKNVFWTFVLVNTATQIFCFQPLQGDPSVEMLASLSGWNFLWLELGSLRHRGGGGGGQSASKTEGSATLEIPDIPLGQVIFCSNRQPQVAHQVLEQPLLMHLEPFGMRVIYPK